MSREPYRPNAYWATYVMYWATVGYVHSLLVVSRLSYKFTPAQHDEYFEQLPQHRFNTAGRGSPIDHERNQGISRTTTTNNKTM
eukprot:scaffold228283_cov40-Attheya_sp.AAC.1